MRTTPARAPEGLSNRTVLNPPPRTATSMGWRSRLPALAPVLQTREDVALNVGHHPIGPAARVGVEARRQPMPARQVEPHGVHRQRLDAVLAFEHVEEVAADRDVLVDA